MARHYTVHSDDLVLRELKRQLEKKSGIHLHSFSDCKRLSEVLDHHGIHIAAMTLSRCFGITKSEHRPFLSTLDLLSSYLGFASFNQFSRETNDFVKYSLTYPELKFSAGEYVYSALELAIQVNDWKSIRNLINSFDPTQSAELEFVWFLGKQVRNHSEKNTFLALLADTENGRKYFYEWFVDEDDPDGYYSKGIELHYHPKSKSIGEQLFYHAFLDSKRIYNELATNKTHRSIYAEASSNLDKLHYQQVSRLFEMRILSEYREMNRSSEMEKIVDELLQLIPNKYWRDQNWMLMRPIKALVFTGHFNALLEHHLGLRNQIKKQYMVCEGAMLSSADLALQFIVHASKEFKDFVQMPPTRLRNIIFNDEKSRIILESATALLYSKPPLRQSMEKNLNRFTAKNEHAWVTQLLKT